MCGILGLTWRDDTRAQKALASMRHRGPDDEGIEYGDVTLGSTRLSIQDLSSAGHMPMTRDHLTIVFNGEVFNFRDVRKELSNFDFESDTDTEVVLRAYQTWGPTCLRKFRGMFAFCIHDRIKNELFMVRDRFGMKPLYYLHDKRGLAFCSEINGILNFVSKREVDPEGLRQFLTFRFTLGETTMLNGVKKLRPGHYLVFNTRTGVVKTQRWYELKTSSRKISFSKDSEDVRAVLDDAVKSWLVSDVPVACLLSGGLDSSIIAALAKKHDANLHTYSIGFETTNELPHAERVANHLGTNHRAQCLNIRDVEAYRRDD
jgi:asparagine synthase (glutamine-hydrolysing)